MVHNLDTLEGQLLCLKGIGFEVIQYHFNEDRTSFLYKLRKTGFARFVEVVRRLLFKKERGI
jgi:hypothetical protein